MQSFALQSCFWAVIFICSGDLLQCKFICICVFFFVNILTSELYI